MYSLRDNSLSNMSYESIQQISKEILGKLIILFEYLPDGPIFELISSVFCRDATKDDGDTDQSDRKHCDNTADNMFTVLYLFHKRR